MTLGYQDRAVIQTIHGPLDESQVVVERREQDSSDRAQIAQRFGLPPEAGERLRGDTEPELAADARGLADAVGASPPIVNFDGGVRESAPLPSDPGKDHGDLILDVVAGLTPDEIERKWKSGW